MKPTILLILCLVAVSLLLSAGCTQYQAPQQTSQPAAVTTATTADTIKTADSPLGKILVDAQGNTLYYFANDIGAGGSSTCTGQCAATWPAFSTDTIRVSSPLDPADFASVTRADGVKQTSYYGWPLYYYKADTKPGDMNGDNFNHVWFVVMPDESVLVAHTAALGLFLIDTSGKTLYYFTNDAPGKSSCSGTCIATWPAFSASPVTAPSFVKPADFTQLSRSDSMKQTAYMGRPLYFFSGDTNPGDTKGQGFRGIWYVANVSGAVPVVTTIPTTLNTLSPTGGGYSMSGGY